MENKTLENIEIEATALYEFTKSFVIAAETDFKELDGRGATSRDVETACSLVGGGIGLGLNVGLPGLGIGLAGGILATVFRAIADHWDGNKHAKNKLYAMCIIGEESKKFEETFRRLFISFGVETYKCYEFSLAKINLEVTTKSRDIVGNNRVAIQLLGKYAGSKCFGYMMGTRSTGNLLNVLTCEKKFKSEISSLWQGLTEVKFYYWNLKGETVGGKEIRKKKKVSVTMYDFFLNKVPPPEDHAGIEHYLLLESSECSKSLESLTCKAPHLLNESQVGNNDRKSRAGFLKFWKFLLKGKVPRGDSEDEDSDCEDEEMRLYFVSVGDISSGFLIDRIYNALILDKSYDGMGTVSAEVDALYKIIEEKVLRKLDEIQDTVNQIQETVQEIDTKINEGIENENKIIYIAERNSEKLDTILSRQAEVQPIKKIIFKVQKPIHTFTGREDFLTVLHESIQKSKNAGGMTILTQSSLSVIASTGGIGKTETVRMYIQLHMHEYHHVIWIDAQDYSIAQARFHLLAQKLQIPTEFNSKPKDFELLLDEVYDKLFENSALVLLIFDNASALDDDEAHHLTGIRNYFPKSLAPPSVEPTILITSRNQNWRHQNIMRLDFWTISECVNFILKQLELESTAQNQKMAAKLGLYFGCLPIALQSVVAVIREQTKRKRSEGAYGIPELLQDYESGKRSVLNEIPWDHSHSDTELTKTTLMALWNVTFEKVHSSENGDLAIKALSFMAYLSPTVIPETIMYALFSTDDPNYSRDPLDKALNLLADYSLITEFKKHFTIHRMIQDVIMEKLKSADHVCEKSSGNLLTFTDADTNSDTNGILMEMTKQLTKYLKSLSEKELLAQRNGDAIANCVHVAGHVSDKLLVTEFRDFTEVVGNSLHQTYDYEKAIKMYENILEGIAAGNESEINHQETIIKIKGNIADVLDDQGNFNQSKELHLETLNLKIALFGPNHMETLNTQSKIAYLLQREGDYDEAIKMFNIVQEGRKEINDFNSPDALTTKNNFSTLIYEQGHYNEALGMLLEVLEGREKVLGPDHKDTLTTKSRIAGVHREKCEYKKAELIYFELQEQASRLFGPDHKDTLRFKNNYAIILKRQGKFKMAVDIYKEVLEAEERILGSQYRGTITIKNNLASALIELGEYDDAIRMLYEVIEIWERKCGSNHPKTLNSQFHLADAMFKKGNFEDSMQLFKKVLKGQEEVMGLSHPKTLDTKHNIGLNHYENGEFEEAAKIAKEVLSLREEVFGSGHPRCVETNALVDKSLAKIPAV